MRAILLGVLATTVLYGDPCVQIIYPPFDKLPAAPPVGSYVKPDPTGVGERWGRVIQTALRPDPSLFTWYMEYGVWTCRYRQNDLVIWSRFPESANQSGIVGTIVLDRLLVAPYQVLARQGLQPQDLHSFTDSDLQVLEARLTEKR